MDGAFTSSKPSSCISSQARRRWGARAWVVLIDGVLAGVGGVYLTTGSVAITIIDAVVAVVVVAMVLTTQR